MDVLHKTLNWIDHNRFKAAAVVLTLCLMVYAGCAVTTASLQDPARDVDVVAYSQEAADLRAALVSEAFEINSRIDAFNTKEELGYSDLQSKQAKKQAVINMVSTGALTAARAAGVPIPDSASKWILGIVSVLGGVGTVAGYLDGRTKDKIIKNGKANA